MALSTRFATAVTSCASLPRTRRSAGGSPTTGDVALLGGQPGAVARPRRRRSPPRRRRRPGIGSAPCTRDSSISSPTSRPSRVPSCCMRVGEPGDGRRVVRGVLHRLGQQRQRADRRLQLVRDVGDEVPAHRLEPALLADVVEQQGHRTDAPGSSGSRSGTAPRPARSAPGRVDRRQLDRRPGRRRAVADSPRESSTSSDTPTGRRRGCPSPRAAGLTSTARARRGRARRRRGERLDHRGRQRREPATIGALGSRGDWLSATRPQHGSRPGRRQPPRRRRAMSTRTGTVRSYE